MRILVIWMAGLLFIAPAIAQNMPAGINTNVKAPEFSAQDQNNNMVSLTSELKKGPVVLVFYRGQWCPYCNRQLKALEDSLYLIKAKGAGLIAVSPEKPVNISKTIDKTKASYPILFDKGLAIMKSYDVAYSLDSATVIKYRKFGIDFTDANGENGTNLPVPAVYIISQKGIITFRHFDPDYRKRASVSEILMHLED